MSETTTSANPVSLRLENLTRVPSGIAVPQYERRSLSPGIVHIGLGNFHRAHQAWYLHRLMQTGKAHDWAIVGAGVRPNDRVMRDKLLEQDCLTTLIELDPSGTSAEIIGSMIDFLPMEEGNGALISQMADPTTRIVSLTVTEGGYFVDPVSGGFDAKHPDIRHDVDHPRSPRTAFGAIVEALRLRRAAGNGPFSLLSCDNLQGNGKVLRQTVFSLARLVDQDLADWINDQVTFPNSMVDCIVPATGPDEIAAARALGVDDAAPVTHENFRQWVIEDDFCAGRPPWDDAGAIFTDQVHAYESMKIRMLNAGHQVLANAGELLSLPTIASCMADPLVSGLFRKVLTEDIIPFVDAVPTMGAEGYLALIERRFSNPRIRDTTRRVAFDGSSRHSGFLLPVLREALAAGRSVRGLALVEALWARMCAGIREDGTAIEPNDPMWDQLNRVALEARSRPVAWLEQEQLYGDLSEQQEFSQRFCAWLESLWSDGCEATLKLYLAG